jgi:hypothetical protein
MDGASDQLKLTRRHAFQLCGEGRRGGYHKKPLPRLTKKGAKMKTNTGGSYKFQNVLFRGHVKVFRYHGRYNAARHTPILDKVKKWADRIAGNCQRRRLMRDNDPVYRSKVGDGHARSLFSVIPLPGRSPDLMVHDRAIFKPFRARLAESLNSRARKQVRWTTRTYERTLLDAMKKTVELHARAVRPIFLGDPDFACAVQH